MNKKRHDAIGKTVLITGAAKRIGAELARSFHQHGFHIIAHYGTSKTEAEALADDLNQQRNNSCELIQANLNNHRELHDLAQSVIDLDCGLDVLINNASSFYPTPIGECNETQWDELMGSNVKAPLFLSQALTPSLKNNRGCIINMADIHADRPMAEHTIYNIAKAATVMLTKSLAKELAPQIRVNAIAPGAILWPENSAPNPEILSKIPLGEIGEATPICKAALYLALDASYTTGQILAIDGGRTLTM